MKDESLRSTQIIPNQHQENQNTAIDGATEHGQIDLGQSAHAAHIAETIAPWKGGAIDRWVLRNDRILLIKRVT